MVLINLDRLYDETLYDFCGCFKQYAINRYLRRPFQDIAQYWGPLDNDEAKSVFNEFRHTFPEGASILEQLEIYKRFCQELLFSPEDHANFYEILITMGRNIERNNKTKVGYFSVNAVIGIAESLWNQCDYPEPKDTLLARCRQKITTTSTVPFLAIEGELLTICRNGLRVTDRSNWGEGMFEYRVDSTSERQPCANIIFNKAFTQYNEANLGTERVLYKNTDAPPKFQNVSINDFIRNPLGIHRSFSELKVVPYTFKSPQPSDFPGCRPDLVIFGAQVSKQAIALREHIFLTMWANDNFIGQGAPVDLRKCRDSKTVFYDTPPMQDDLVQKLAFWSLGLTPGKNGRFLIDFKGQHLKRNRPRGCTIPSNVAQELIAMDLKLTSDGDAVTAEQLRSIPGNAPALASAMKTTAAKTILGGKRKRVEKTTENTVRFTGADQVNMVPKNDPSRGGATVEPKRSRPKREKPESEKQENNKIAFVAAALLAFLGLFYWNP